MEISREHGERVGGLGSRKMKHWFAINPVTCFADTKIFSYSDDARNPPSEPYSDLLIGAGRVNA